MSIRVEPRRDEEGWSWPAGEVVARRVTGGWEYARPGLEAPIRVADDGDGDGAPFAVRLTLGAEPVVLYVDPPILLQPNEQRELWLALPLEIVATRAGVESDRFRPGRRWTLLGSVSTGRVLPAVRCPIVASPDATGVGVRAGRAALRVRVRIGAEEPTILRRLPVAPDELALYERGDALVASEVVVEVYVGKRAGARSLRGSTPEGFALVEAPSAERRGLSLDWLLDATRRSTEFDL